ncbi:hypothetical protein ACKWTF_014496 [Chironomus riparius]
MNLKILIFLQFLTILTVKCGKQKNSYNDGTRFQSIECISNNLTATIAYCYMKAVSRKVVTLNVGVKLTKPINKPIYVQFIFYYRYGIIYHEVINTKKQEWCGIMDGKSAHPMILQTLAQIKATAPGLFHKCPYEDLVELKNVTIDDTKSFDVFPAGHYKTSVLTFDKNEDPFFSMNLTHQIKSSLKETMGK